MPEYNWTPAQQVIVDRINSGQQDRAFGPYSPNPTNEDLNTYVGGRYSPAGGFSRSGGVALAPSEYYLFSPQQRQYLGIMDIAPRSQEGMIERYFGPNSRIRKAASTIANPGRALNNALGRGLPPIGTSSDPFRGWSQRQVEQWHNAPGYNQVMAGGSPYIGTNPGNMQGGPTLDPTSWVNVPGVGNVPQAIPVSAGDQIRGAISQISGQPGNLMASNDPSYMSTLFGIGRGQPGSGVPTQRAVGTVVGTASNLIIPGLGFLTGPLARLATRLMQSGMSPEQARVVVAQRTQTQQPQPAQAPAPSFSPFGGLPEGFREGNRFGGGAPIFSLTGSGLNYGPQWTPGGSIFNTNNLGPASNAVAPSQGPYHSAGGVPAPGSIGGVFGQGSAGSLMMGGYDYLADASRRAAARGGDPTLGLLSPYFQNNGFGAWFPTNRPPPSIASSNIAWSPQIHQWTPAISATNPITAPSTPYDPSASVGVTPARGDVRTLVAGPDLPMRKRQ